MGTDGTAALIVGLVLYAVAMMVAWLPLRCRHGCPICADEAERKREADAARRKAAEHEWRHTVWGRKNCPFCDEDSRPDE